MNANQGIIIGFFFMALAGEIGCHPSQVPAEDTFDDFLTQEDITALTKILEQDDVLKSTKSILKHIWPFKKYLLPIFKKILIGISKSKNPTDILLDIIRVLEEGIEKNKKNMKPRKEENSTNAEEERTKEEEVYEPSASGESDLELQEYTKEIHPKFKITGPEEW
ncbi:unnamed protein product [Porites lobata]|uniref:Uncharacterized protein n=1 Tax=Porites lobata TaxID=104759 RepID=A0ABN8N2U7_9CNID|nr:unnamed protein product [Porites lobata]